MNKKEIKETLIIAKELITEGIECESITIIEGAHDTVFKLEYDNTTDKELSDEISSIVDNLKSSYKNYDFDDAKKALTKLDTLISEIQ